MRIGILTAFSEWLNHYSLTSVVREQIRMIRSAGHTPVLFTLENFSAPPSEHSDYELFLDVEIQNVIPFHHKTDYATHKDVTEVHLEVAKKTYAAIEPHVRGLDAVFTHDILFTGWNLVINMAMRHLCDISGPFWFHWIHSVPGGGKRDYWSLPANSVLVYPNNIDAIRCAEHFSTSLENILVCPHSVDPRSYLFQTSEADSLVTDYEILHADIIQTFPVPTDRIESKGIEAVISVFAELKKLGRSVRLIIPNSWCTNADLNASVDKWKAFARNLDLNEREVIFTSRIFPEHAVGLPGPVVRDLMLISNLFICPSKSETFGFTIAEAALTGQLLVLNSSFPAMMDLAGSGNALFFTFGSYQQTVNNSDWPKFYKDVAKIILHRMDTDAALRAKHHYRVSYNRDTVWATLDNAIQTYRGAGVTVRR